MLAGFRETGGYEKLVDSFFDAVATNRSLQVPSDPDSGLCGGVPEDSMHLIRDAVFLNMSYRVTHHADSWASH